MAHNYRETTYNENGTAVGNVVFNGRSVATIYWGESASTECDIIDLTISRMENKAKNGMGSVAESKALILLHQAKAELNGGQKTLDDGTPIFGGSP